MAIHISHARKSTSHCTVILEGGASLPTKIAVVQRILRHDKNEERIRFGYHRGNKFQARPLEVTEEQLPEVIEGALAAGVFSADTIAKLKEILSRY